MSEDFPSKVTFNDVFPGGAILQKAYRKRKHSLYLWHFAYREGKRIELARVPSHEALEMAHQYWGERLLYEDLPRNLVDASGKAWERKWYTLRFDLADPDENELEDL